MDDKPIDLDKYRKKPVESGNKEVNAQATELFKLFDTQYAMEMEALKANPETKNFPIPELRHVATTRSMLILIGMAIVIGKNSK